METWHFYIFNLFFSLKNVLPSRLTFQVPSALRSARRQQVCAWALTDTSLPHFTPAEDVKQRCCFWETRDAEGALTDCCTAGRGCIHPAGIEQAAIYAHAHRHNAERRGENTRDEDDGMQQDFLLYFPSISPSHLLLPSTPHLSASYRSLMITVWSSGFNPRLEDKYSCHAAVKPDLNLDYIDDDDDGTCFSVSYCWWYMNTIHVWDWVRVHVICCLFSCLVIAPALLMLTFFEFQIIFHIPFKQGQAGNTAKLSQRALKGEINKMWSYYLRGKGRGRHCHSWKEQQAYVWVLHMNPQLQLESKKALTGWVHKQKKI